MARLADISMILTGVAPPAPPAGEARYVQIKDLDPSRRRLSKGGVPTAGRASPIAGGDVLLPARGDRSVVVRPDPELIGAFPTLDLYLIRPNAERLDPDFLAAFLSLPEVAKAIRASTAGASLPRIPKEALAELDVPMPSLARQRTIGALAACTRRQAELAARLNAAEARLGEARLSHLFQTLESFQ